MPPKHTKNEVKTTTESEDVPMAQDHDGWAHEDEDEDDDVEDEFGGDTLMRMSEHYRRNSGYRRHVLSGDEVEDQDEDEDEDHAHDEDEDMDQDQDQDQDDALDRDEGDNDLHQQDNVHRAIRDIMRSLGNSTTGGDSGRSLSENMQRLFPGVISLYESMNHGGDRPPLIELINGLNRRDSPFLVMEGLNEISERLLVMNAITATALPVNALSKALVDVLDDPALQDELELQLAACRCLYNFLEVNPDYSHILIHDGAIEALRSKLLEISYIDLAEQTLQALLLMSKISGTAIFRRDCLGACLQYLDFLTIHAQRKAVEIVANSVKYINDSEFHLVEEIFPTLQRIVIEMSDSQEVENAWLAITRIIKSFQSSPLLSKLISDELIKKIVSVISLSDTTLSTNLKLVNTLSICAKNPELSKSIIKSNQIVESLNLSLAKYSKNNDHIASIETLMNVPKDLILVVLDLFMNILPPVSEPPFLNTRSHSLPKDYSSIKVEYFNFANDIFDLLINIYQSSVVFEIRRGVLVCMMRIISSIENVRDLREVKSITGLLASLVIQNKGLVRTESKNQKTYFYLLCALLLTLHLIKKDPDYFIAEFESEGLFSDTSSLLETLRMIHPYRPGDTEIDNTETNDKEESTKDESHDQSAVTDEEDDDIDNYDEDEDGEDDDIVPPQTLNPAFKIYTINELATLLIKVGSKVDQIYLSKKASGSSKLEHLRLLDELSRDLSDQVLISSYKFEDWKNLWVSLSQALFKEDSTISSFELLSSGIIDVLSKLFNNPNYGEEGALARNSFKGVFKSDLFDKLIRKLQESLNRSEMFEILQCGLRTDENRALSLGKQIRIRLTAADDESKDFFKSMSQFVMLVHSVSSFKNVSSFLKRKIENPFVLASRVPQPTGIENSQPWHIEFLLDGELVSLDNTIYGALYKNSLNKDKNFNTYEFWNQIHEIKFRKADGALGPAEFDDRYPELENDFTSDADSDSLSSSRQIKSILDLLKRLHDFCPESPFFLNFKLTAKLNRQLEEPLIVSSGLLPTWSINITREYAFLFPMETRIFFLQSTSFGHSRLIQLWNNKVNQHQEGNGDHSNILNDITLGRPTRHKIRVSRNHLLASCLRVLDKLGSNPSILEIEFTEEVGTGLGPTLEFYANVSHLFAKKALGIWRQDQEDEADKSVDFIHNKEGLFPLPLISKDKDYSLRVKHFRYIGKFVARALLDNRIVDMNFNKLFFELAHHQVSDPEYKLPPHIGFSKLQYVDKRLYDSLSYLQANKSEIEGLEITFTLPGHEDYELIENGSNIQVSSDNIDKYIDLVVEASLESGVKEQIESFIVGFSEVFPFFAMSIFSPYEMVNLLGKSEEDWSFETLISSVRAAHGYTLESRTVQNLITVMSRFDNPKRRLFLQFMTGSPRLPIGGFKNMKPVFTVVLKGEEDGLKPDDYLPSVMTCANYLKLPDYSSREVLESRLEQAITEGSGSFLLS